MNTNIIYLSIALTVLLVSCDGMNDIHQEYLDRGELNYIGMVENAAAIGGKERIQLKWELNNDPRIEQCEIYWNDKADSVVYEFTDEEFATGSVSFTLDDIIEGDYLFQMYHAGSKGGRSIKTEISGVVYGKNYESQLTSRRIQLMEAAQDSVILNWAVPEPEETGSVLTYINREGNSMELEIAPEEEQTVLKDYVTGGSLKVITTYLPEPDALDEFVAESSDLTFPDDYKLDKSAWTSPAYDDNSGEGTIGYSSQEAGGEGSSPKGRIIAMFDNNTSTFWHTRWSSPGSSYPHWFIVDLGAEYDVTHIEITKRLENTRGETGHQFFTCTEAGSIDPSDPETWNWEDQGEYPFDPTLDAAQRVAMEDRPLARYIKVYIGEKYEGQSSSAMISEFSVYGKQAN